MSKFMLHDDVDVNNADNTVATTTRCFLIKEPGQKEKLHMCMIFKL